jgi:hypothetical protein
MMGLTSEQISQVAAVVMPELSGHSECSYLLDGDPHPYKPFYRATSILLTGGKDSTPSKLLGLSRPVTLDEAKAILSEAHPYFAAAIARDPEQYAGVYEFHYEALGDRTWPT